MSSASKRGRGWLLRNARNEGEGTIHAAYEMATLHLYDNKDPSWNGDVRIKSVCSFINDMSITTMWGSVSCSHEGGNFCAEGLIWVHRHFTLRQSQVLWICFIVITEPCLQTMISTVISSRIWILCDSSTKMKRGGPMLSMKIHEFAVTGKRLIGIMNQQYGIEQRDVQKDGPFLLVFYLAMIVFAELK